jgi:hypothetical protein
MGEQLDRKLTNTMETLKLETQKLWEVAVSNVESNFKEIGKIEIKIIAYY